MKHFQMSETQKDGKFIYSVTVGNADKGTVYEFTKTNKQAGAILVKYEGEDKIRFRGFTRVDLFKATHSDIISKRPGAVILGACGEYSETASTSKYVTKALAHGRFHMYMGEIHSKATKEILDLSYEPPLMYYGTPEYTQVRKAYEKKWNLLVLDLIQRFIFSGTDKVEDEKYKTYFENFIARHEKAYGKIK